MTIAHRRAAAAASLLLLSACGLLTGIKPLDVDAEDSGAVTRNDAEASVDVDGARRTDGSAEAQAQPPHRPPEGTYTYTVTGSDKLFGAVGSNATYGTPASVTIAYVGTGCFTQTLNLRDNYQQTMNLCIKGLTFVEDGETRSQRFVIGIAAQTAQTTLTCTPGDVYFSSDPSSGQSWNHDCSGKNTDDKTGNSAFSTIGSYSFIGNEVIQIAGSDVPVRHFHDDRNISGTQTGKNIADWYFAVEDGILVRLARNIDIGYISVIGTVNYRESELMTLQTPPSLLRDAGKD